MFELTQHTRLRPLKLCSRLVPGVRDTTNYDRATEIGWKNVFYPSATTGRPPVREYPTKVNTATVKNSRLWLLRNRGQHPTHLLPSCDGRHPSLLVLAVYFVSKYIHPGKERNLPIKVQQHPQHRNELPLMRFVLLLQELQKHILQIDVVHSALAEPGWSSFAASARPISGGWRRRPR